MFLFNIFKDYKLMIFLKYQHSLNKNKRPIFDYDFLMNLNEKEYPKYLKMAYNIILKQKLNLKHPKNINEKIQWLKIYDNMPVKTQLTDKVKVRDWVKEKIGENYLKPVLQICSSFDEIDFDNLPESFIVKCNHGCKWHFKVKDKKSYLENEKLYNISKNYINSWMAQSFFGWSDFEPQYKNIKPQIIIEPLLTSNNNEPPEEYEVYCFNSEPKISQKCYRKNSQDNRHVNSFDCYFKPVNLKFIKNDVLEYSEADNYLKEAVKLSKILAQDFKFVRVDWMKNKDKLYFAEMTFTPYSGFYEFDDEYKSWLLRLGNMLDLKGK